MRAASLARLAKSHESMDGAMIAEGRRTALATPAAALAAVTRDDDDDDDDDDDAVKKP